MAIIGTARKDALVGFEDSDDQMFGLEGDDSLFGFSGNDFLNGGPGDDAMYGGLDDDAYVVDSRDDEVIEHEGEGTDFVHSSVDYRLPDNVENLGLMAGAGAINGHGNDLDNMILGNESANVIWGHGGDDDIDGGGGADSMIGGLGDDTYYVDDPWDWIIEYLDQGTDWVWASVDYTLPDHVEVLVLSDSGTALEGTGNAQGNWIYGNVGDNTLSGGDGSDLLDGGLGADTLIGGDGNDIYFVDDIGDNVVEKSASWGTDLVVSSISYTLGTFEENLTLQDNGTISGTGNELNNTIIGGTGNNALNGGLGFDILTGNAGVDAFWFSTALDASSNIDIITDFSFADEDAIVLDDAIFDTLVGSGSNIADFEFRIGSAAADADDRIIYDDATGALYFDADGTGKADAIQFATLAPGLALTHYEFIIV